MLLARLSRSVSHSARKFQIAKGSWFRPCVHVHASYPHERDGLRRPVYCKICVLASRKLMSAIFTVT
jgi:hypothetical protein